MASTEWSAFIAAAAAKGLQVQPVALVAKGTGTNNLYMVEVDQSTGTLVTSGGGGGGGGVIATQGTTGNYSQDDTTQTQVKVGASNLAGRTLVIISNTHATAKLYWGFDALLAAANGIPIPAGQTASLAIGDGVSIYTIAESGATINVRVAEAF